MQKLLIVTVLLFTIVAHGQKEISTNTISEMKRSIVPIVCGYEDEKGKFQLVEVAGSGFFVDEHGRFITAGHVLNDWDKISKTRHVCRPVIYIPDEGWQGFARSFVSDINVEFFYFTDCISDSKLDLAVCEPIENPFISKRVSGHQIRFVSFDTFQWLDGTPVAFTGFPLEYTTPITSVGHVAGVRGIGESGKNFDFILDKSAWPGASGSLVYLSTGRVIGIILQAGVDRGAGLAYARSASAITAFLAAHPYGKKEEHPGGHPSEQ